MNTTKKSDPALTASLCFLLLFFLIPIQISGQCGASDLLPASDCEQAQLICLQNWCYETTNESGVGEHVFCGPNTAIHNPQYYEVIATDEQIEIHIEVGDCTGGQNALQFALIQACPWEIEDVIDCNPGAAEGQTAILQGVGLIIGQSYWVLIDGSAGSTCAYAFTYLSGIQMPLLSNELNSISANPSSVVQGYKDLPLEVSPAITEAHGYYWVLSWSGDTLVSTLPNTTIDIPCDLTPGLYEICARAFSGCDTTDSEVCTQIEVLSKGPEVEIYQVLDTLCTNIPEGISYRWFDCTTQVTLSTSACFSPSSTGCYCAALTDTIGCTEIACYEFIYSAISQIADEQILISPVPSGGTLEIHLSNKIDLPVKWTLVDTWGRGIENGTLDQHLSTIQLQQVPPPGHYYLHLLSAGHQTMTSKLIFEAE